MRVEDINIREVLTSKLQKTIEIEIKTKKGTVHSVASVNRNGIYRIRNLPPEDAVKKFLDIKRHFANQTFDDQQEVDNFLRKIDISADFRDIGGNLAFAISSAFLKSFARWEGVKIYERLIKNKPELPVPACVVANKENSQTDFKEFLLYPVQQKIFSKGIVRLINVYNELKLDNNLTNDKMLRLLSSVTTKNSLEVGINFGGTNLWNERRYAYRTGENLNGQEQLMLIQDIARNYPVGYIEDPFHEDDFVLFSTLTHRLPTRLVVGNDVYSNNFERFQRGVETKASSGIVIDPTQMGTITDVINMANAAKKNKISAIMSSELDDKLISNLAVGLRFDYIKLKMDSISVNRTNELIRIEGDSLLF